MKNGLDQEVAELTDLERRVINGLQGGFPVCKHPFAVAAIQFGIDAQTLVDVIQGLQERNVITRFGPLFDIQKAGGDFCLCAISTPADAWQETADTLNAMPEVAHNYLRDHAYNLWFVLATETAAQIDASIAHIEASTGYPVLALPKEKEYFIGLYLEV
ncbi:MAG: Lrp/AsnC family transcriptional regulator [Gammaproteobacteria bacterium]|nr:Lrp/AsnC family transcriptional regulator [Gammaproteobacteria bacterium]